MPNKVVIIVSSKVVGRTRVVPYSHEDGLQMHRPAPGIAVQPVQYEVPLYEVQVEGAGSYAAIRFGLRNNGRVSATRGCDAGLSHERTCTPGWLPYYRPHTFQGGRRLGAWQLIPGQDFLIHEGADAQRRGEWGGSIGCIEIVDGFWNSFLNNIEHLAGAPCSEVGHARALTVKIRAASYPVATLVI